MMVHFIRPNFLWLLLPAALYLTWIMHSVRQHNPWKNVCDAHLLPALLETNVTPSRHLFHGTLVLLYAISIFALAGPALKKVSLPVYRDVSSMILVLDLSNAMNETDLKPTRLARAKYKIRDLINTAQNMQMGLVAFTGEAFTASPLSQDANTLSTLLDELDPAMMPLPGSDSGQGLAEGYQLLKQAGAPQGNVLLITASEPGESGFSAAKTIAAAGGHVNVLAMLDNVPANQLVLSHLQQLAKAGDGTLIFFSADASDIQSIVSAVSSKHVINNENSENAYAWLDAGPWFCLLLIPLALWVLRENKRHEND